MENNNPLNPQEPEKKSISPLLVLGLLALCSICLASFLCGGVVWVARNPNNLSFLAGPTEDIVQDVSSDPAWQLSLEDDFISNIYDWNLEPDKEDTIILERTMENGKYVWDFQAKSEWSFWNWPDMEKSNDFVAAMELQHTVGSRADWYGIVFRISGGNFYCFEVDESGVFGAWLFYQDEYKSLISGNRVYLIKPGEINQVAVKAVGSKFSFYINQQLVGEAEDDTLPIGYVGMILHPSGNPQDSAGTAGPNSSSQNELEWQQSVFEIENFKIWVPKGSKQAGSISLSLLNPEPGYLVYMSSRDGNTEIYSSDTKGKNPVRLTNDPAEDYSPRWSPDGKQIVFVSERDGNPEIYVMNRDGSGLTRLTDDSADDLDPSWSPDGKKIVFSSERGGYKIFKIYVLDIETKSVERITNGHLDVFPEWSPDGNLIIFQSTREHSQDFYIIDVKTKKENRITFKTYTSVARPAWSPDGLSYVHETILSDDQIGITISDYPNTQIEVVVDTVNVNVWPAWSPDGNQIAFVSYRNGESDIYIISRDGKSIYRVTNDSGIEAMVDWTAE